jgi:formyltetrahydrofolate deformylase
MRIEWELEGFSVVPERIAEEFTPLASRFQMDWQLKFSKSLPRLAVFVSQLDHCLYEILLRTKAGEWRAEIPVIISNHEDLKPVADYFQIPFRYFPVDASNREQSEKSQLELLHRNNIDTIILARYMQVLSGAFVRNFPNRIINIHHSFLPAFVGAKPYHQAFERGVKLIGATSHYVTEQLDQGPIIAQDVVHVSHRDSLDDFIRKGRELEKTILARAVKCHLENKTLVFGNKTIVFD